jgi:hypothetical protein
MRQYYVLTQDPTIGDVLDFIAHYSLRCEIHLNRTRFWIPEGSVLTECLLRFPTLRPVDPLCDLASGLQDCPYAYNSQ